MEREREGAEAGADHPRRASPLWFLLKRTAVVSRTSSSVACQAFTRLLQNWGAVDFDLSCLLLFWLSHPEQSIAPHIFSLLTSPSVLLSLLVSYLCFYFSFFFPQLYISLNKRQGCLQDRSNRNAWVKPQFYEAWSSCCKLNRSLSNINPFSSGLVSASYFIFHFNHQLVVNFVFVWDY